jgi:hypothetical protein
MSKSNDDVVVVIEPDGTIRLKVGDSTSHPQSDEELEGLVRTVAEFRALRNTPGIRAANPTELPRWDIEVTPGEGMRHYEGLSN